MSEAGPMVIVIWPLWVSPPDDVYGTVKVAAPSVWGVILYQHDVLLRWTRVTLEMLADLLNASPHVTA